LIQRLKPRTVTAGGIQLPESAQAKQNVGVVLAVGDKVEKIQINDQVVLSEYAGTELKIDGEEFHLFRDEDILGILKN
jgi:chaperonin GroES